MEPYIDAHCHVWTPDVGRYPLARSFTVDQMQPPSFTAEELLAICRPSGVGRVNLIQMSYYEFDNSYLLDCIAQYPDRFVGTAIVDPLGPDPAAAMRALAPRGVRAFRIQPHYSKRGLADWLAPEGYQAMFAEAARSQQVLSCLIDPEGLREVDRLCRQFPETPVVIDHMARIGVDGTIRDADVQALCDLAQHPRVYVKVGAFYALGKKQPPYLDLAPLIRRVLQAYGSRRLMWESDCPFQVVQHTYDDSIALIRDRLDFLSDDDRDWLLTRTAQRLLFTT
ncbi:MAG: amidohydrolase [Isosphaeraceae bacterium]|jgi:predicted TIM-barrel fold metal-dependent hydrolase|nr:MAG: amidohydrolase [Isosphaeraceae bacterium]